MAQYEAIMRRSTLYTCDHPRCEAQYEIVEHAGTRMGYNLNTHLEAVAWRRADSDRAEHLKNAGWTTITGPNPRHMCPRHAIRKSYPIH